MKRIGITGGMGSGKTTVSQYLLEKGHNVIDADKVARELVENGSPALLELARIFGDQIITAEGGLDRSSLAAIAFTDPQKKHQLDQVMHPRILERIESLIEELPVTETIFVDAALIFEAGWDEYFDQIWLVDATEEMRIERIQNRDKLTREQIKARMNAQFKTAERRQRADRILWNDGDRESLYMQVESLLDELKGAQ